MANVNSPQGGTPVRHIYGAPYNAAGNLYYVQASDTNTMGIGDFVKSTGDSDPSGVANITLATANDPLRGVIVGFVVNPDTPQLLYRYPSTYAGVLVMDDPNVLIAIQASAVYTGGNVGQNANIVVGAVNTFSGVSTTQVDSTTFDTNSALQLRIIGTVQTPNNAIGTNTNLLCIMNTHEFKVGSNGV